MDKLYVLGIFFIGLGIFLASLGFFWWCSLYEKINLKKKKKEN